MVPDPHETKVFQLVALLREKRRAQGLSHEKLAKKAGLSYSGLRHIENRDVQPTLYSLLKIADALEVELPTLLRKALHDAE